MNDDLNWLLDSTAEPEAGTEAAKAEKAGKSSEGEKQTVSEQFLNDVNQKSHDDDFWKSDEDENVFDDMKLPAILKKHTHPCAGIRLPAPEIAPLPALSFPFSTYIDDTEFSEAVVFLTLNNQLEYERINSAKIIIDKHKEDEPEIYELVKNWWETARRITDIRKNQGGINGRSVNSYFGKLSCDVAVIFCKALGYSETTIKNVLEEMF